MAWGASAALQEGLEHPVETPGAERAAEHRDPGGIRELEKRFRHVLTLGDEDDWDAVAEQGGEAVAHAGGVERREISHLGLAEDLYPPFSEATCIPREGEPGARHVGVGNQPIQGRARREDLQSQRLTPGVQQILDRERPPRAFVGGWALRNQRLSSLRGA